MVNKGFVVLFSIAILTVTDGVMGDTEKEDSKILTDASEIELSQIEIEVGCYEL